MAKRIYVENIEKIFRKSPVINVSSIYRIIKNKRNVKQYHKQLIRNLILKGKIKRLTKGCYTIHENSSLAVFCFKPAYLGLYDALSFHEIWEQETIPVIITTKKIRQGVRKILGTNVFIKRIKKKYMFGFDYKREGDFYLPYSDIEKTFIDIIYFKKKLDEKTKKNIIKEINFKKLSKYLSHYPKKIKKRVINFYKSD